MVTMPTEAAPAAAEVAPRNVIVEWGTPLDGQRRTLMQEYLDALGWTRRQFARLVGAGANAVDAWCNGDASVDGSLLDYLAAEVEHRAACPPPGPEQWRRRGRGVTLVRNRGRESQDVGAAA
jgi:hypothetical protein